MTGTIVAYWNALKETTALYQEKDPNIVFNAEKYNEFESNFKELYERIKKEYMKPNVRNLDRHKVTAVMIVTTLNLNIITYAKDIGEKHCFLGCEMFSTEVALNWMLDSLNERLKEFGKESLKAYHMPQAFTCSTPYFDIFCRNLYLAKRDYKLNPLDISEKLYLLEYISLQQNNVDLSVLQE